MTDGNCATIDLLTSVDKSYTSHRQDAYRRRAAISIRAIPAGERGRLDDCCSDIHTHARSTDPYPCVYLLRPQASHGIFVH